MKNIPFIFSDLFKHPLLKTLLFTIIISLSSCQKQVKTNNNIHIIGKTIESSVIMASNNIDSAIIILDQAISNATKIGHDSLLVVALMQKAINKSLQGNIKYADSVHSSIIYNELYDIDSSLINKVKLSYAHLCTEWGQYNKALILCQEANTYYEGIQYDRAILAGNLFLANVYTQKLDYTNAMKSLIRALEISEKLEQKQFTAMAYFNMGDLYFKEEQYAKSIECYEIAATNYKASNIIINIAGSYENIGSAYIEMGEIEKAERFILKSRDIYTSIGAYSYAMNNLIKLGTVYDNRNMDNKALNCYNEVLELNKKTKLPPIEASAHSNIGKIYYKQGNYSWAEYYINKAHNIRINSGDTDFRLYYKSMMQLNEAKQNWKEAYLWSRKYDAHSNKIFNIEKHKASEELHTKYETEKKDLQLAAMEAEKEKDKITIIKNRTLNISLGIILLISSIFSYFFLKQYYSKMQSYKDLIRKNKELIAINTNIREKALTRNKTTRKARNKDYTEKSKIADDIVDEVKHNLKDLIHSKFYTDINLTLNDAAEMLNTNTHYLSQIINDTFKCNFPTFINQLRVEEAQLLLKDPHLDHLTIDFIGEKAGFKSKSAFNTAFKKETGLTPSIYKKNLNNASAI